MVTSNKSPLKKIIIVKTSSTIDELLIVLITVKNGIHIVQVTIAKPQQILLELNFFEA